MKKLLSLALCAVMLLGLLCGCSGGTTELRAEQGETWSAPTGTKIDAKEDYVLVAESDSYKLWYYEPRFSIRLENKIPAP